MVLTPLTRQQALEKLLDCYAGYFDITPAHELEDGKDYCPAKAPALMGHHFSSIAGAGPINSPIQAAVFGWVPVMLWILIGGIFFGGIHDFSTLFASIRNKGQSIGVVIAASIGSRAKKLFLIFAYLTLILVVAAFASIVANTFKATYTAEGVLDLAASAATATISILFILMAVVFGFFVYRRNAPLGVATLITVVLGIALGMTGYAKIWALFGAANQLLAALGLLAVCCWLGKIGRNNKMFYIPRSLCSSSP